MRSIFRFVPPTSTPRAAISTDPSVFLLSGRPRTARRASWKSPPPEAAAYVAWRVATTLPRAGCRRARIRLYRAANYDELIDHPGRDRRFRVDVVRSRRRNARHRDHRPARRRPAASRATSRESASGRSSSSADAPLRPLSVPGRRRRRRLRRPRASDEHEPHLQPRRAAARRPWPASLPTIGVSWASRATSTSTLEREAHQAGRLRSRTTSGARTTRASSGRSKASRPTTTTSRWCAAASSMPRAYLELARPHDHDRPARSGPPHAERCRLELRRVDQVLPPR